MQENTHKTQDILEVLKLFSVEKDTDNCIASIEKFIDEEHFDKYCKIKKRVQKRLEFNFFKILTKQWQYENLHSEVIRLLLSKQETLNVFLEFLNAQKLEVQIDIGNYENAKIECEYVIAEQRRIDILITGESSKDGTKHAIIIENKINNAKDQEGQIFDYYKHIKGKDIRVDCIIYLVCSTKTPIEDSLGKGTELESEIKNKLIVLQGFTGKNGGDLVSCLKKVLETLEKQAERENSNEENYRVFLYNYIDLLKDTGAGDMSDLAVKFLEKIESNIGDYEKLQFALKYFLDMQNNLGTARTEQVSQKIGVQGGTKSKNCWKKEYNYDSKTITLEIWSDEQDKTKVLIYGERKETESFGKFKKESKILNKDWTSENATKIRKDFKFPSENAKLIETIKELDKILTEKNF